MGTTLLPAVITALYTTLTNALPDITVYDGPGRSENTPMDMVYVGIQDPSQPSALAQGASAVQDWVGLGAHSRDDNGTVWCVATSWNGNTDLPAARTNAFATVAAVENAIRQDPTLGGVPGVLWTGVTSLDYRCKQDGNGAAVEVMFGVSYRGRI